MARARCNGPPLRQGLRIEGANDRLGIRASRGHQERRLREAISGEVRLVAKTADRERLAEPT